MNIENSIVLGGGCFWCTEAVFRALKGVTRVEPGYAGGMVPFPTYKQVSSGMTGHAEVVRVSFDASIISLQELLTVFFSLHDPTVLNRQGADVGEQYRSIVLYETPEQKRITEQVIDTLTQQMIWPLPIVTKVDALHEFYPAEEYHERYFERNESQPYCSVVISPKLSKLRKDFAYLMQ